MLIEGIKYILLGGTYNYLIYLVAESFYSELEGNALPKIVKEISNTKYFLYNN